MQKTMIARRSFRYAGKPLKAGQQFLASRQDARLFEALKLARSKDGESVVVDGDTIQVPTDTTVAVVVGHIPAEPEVIEPSKVDEPLTLIEPTHSPESAESATLRVKRAMVPEPPVEVVPPVTAEAAPVRVKRKYRRRDIAPSETK